VQVQVEGTPSETKTMLSNGTPTLRSLNSCAVLLAESGLLGGSGVDGVDDEDLVRTCCRMRRREPNWRLKRVRRRRLRKLERVVRMVCVYILVGR